MILSSGNTLVLSEELRAAAVATRTAVAKSKAIDSPNNAGSLEDMERRHIESVLNQVNWTIEGEHGAARILAMNPSTLRSRMQKLGISRPSRPSP